MRTPGPPAWVVAIAGVTTALRSPLRPGTIPATGAALTKRSPLLHRHHRRVVQHRSPQREADRLAHADGGPHRRGCRRETEAGGTRGQEAADLLVGDDEELRVDGAHDAATLPLLLAGAGAGGAGHALALETLHLGAGGIDVAIESSGAAAPPGVAQAEADGEDEIEDQGHLPHGHHRAPPRSIIQCT